MAGKNKACLETGLPAELQDISDDEAQGGKCVAPSPKKARQLSSEVTLEVLQGLLQQQTRELRDANKLELSRAVSQMEEKTRGMVAKLEDKLDDHERELTDLKAAQLDMQRRLAAVESGSTAPGSSAAGDARKPALIMGGWEPLTRKPVLLKEANQVVAKLGLKGMFDGELYAPGVRKGIVLSDIVQRDAETPADCRERMLRILKALNDEAYSSDSFPAGKKLWCSISRPKSERDRAAHASKLRRLLHSLGNGFVAQADTEYPTGSVWLGDSLIGSAVKPRPTTPGSVVADGKLPGAWLDVGKVAAFTRTSTRLVHDAWQRAFEPAN